MSYAKKCMGTKQQDGVPNVSTRILANAGSYTDVYDCLCGNNTFCGTQESFCFRNVFLDFNSLSIFGCTQKYCTKIIMFALSIF